MNPVSARKYYRSLAPLLPPEALCRRPSWREIFGREAPLELEIGFGNGERLHRSTLAAPDRDFVGIEISWPSVKRALRRLGAPPRANARLICMPAAPALRHCFPEESLAGAVALFPVPWPKERHANKRLFSRGFLDLLASRLSEGARFLMVTDDPTLASWTLAQSAGSALPLSLTEKEAGADTKYGRKWEGLGARSFFHLEGSRAFRPSLPPPGRADMQPTFLPSLDPENYSPQGISGETSVVFRGLLFDTERQEGLLNTKVVDGSFVQEFFIRLRPEGDGRWRLYPAFPHLLFPTEGVRAALRLAAGDDF
ncbi:MAG: hypothetical protein LBW85_05205 [Deltaproteobacteria bacterium]|jgi:tRNA (guanine-N7-)-methyltransferase|nr:hypothetical protein [Deltaproteobacteria bacterium]